MRVERLRIKEVFQNVADLAIVGANNVMANHAEDARRRAPRGTITRKDGQTQRDVAFVPKSGRGKGKIVTFIADTWTGREPGSLKASVRKVEKLDRPGNIRVYAGSKKIYYARFVEYGTASTGWGGPAKAQPFMRPSFHVIKGKIRNSIESEMRKEIEVK